MLWKELLLPSNQHQSRGLPNSSLQPTAKPLRGSVLRRRLSSGVGHRWLSHMRMKPFIGTFALCGVTLFLTAPVHGGFLLVFVVPILAVGLLYSVYLIWKRPAVRRLQLVKIALWLLVIGAVCLAQRHYYRAARAAGNVVVASILQYKARHGVFPESLRAAGVEATSWHIAYILKDGRPSVFYPATFVVFDTYRYNFRQHRWELQII